MLPEVVHRKEEACIASDLELSTCADVKKGVWLQEGDKRHSVGTGGPVLAQVSYKSGTAVDVGIEQTLVSQPE